MELPLRRNAQMFGCARAAHPLSKAARGSHISASNGLEEPTSLKKAKMPGPYNKPYKREAVVLLENNTKF